MIVLIMGRSGAGKSTLARLLHLDAAYFNADTVRSMFNDWDFSKEGRIRQVKRMKKLCDMTNNKIKVVDMICPLKEMRAILKPDVIIYLRNKGNQYYKNTDKMFEEPTEDECERLYILD